jgi:hypothetical protein
MDQRAGLFGVLVDFRSLRRHAATMKPGVWQSFARAQLLSRLPGMVMSHTLIHLPDISWLLKGIAMVPVPGQDRFRLWVFIQPLYVPTDQLSFRHGRMLSRGTGRGQTSWPQIASRELGLEIVDSLRGQGLPVLGTVRGPAEFLEKLLSHPDELSQPSYLEAAVYSAVLAGDATAVRLLGHQVRELGDARGVSQALVRARRVLAAFERSDVAAVGTLTEWRNRTVKALCLPDCVPE